MRSVEGIAKLGQAAQAGIEDQQKNQLYEDKQAAAKTAAGLWQAGDQKGAISALISADPATAEKLLPLASHIDPDFAKSLTNRTETGQLEAQTAFGSNPRQLKELDGRNALNTASVRSSKPTIRKDENSPTGFSMITPEGVLPFDAYGQQPGLNKAPTKRGAQGPDGPPNAPAEQLKPVLRPNEDVDSNGEIVMLSPAQQKIIKESRKTFDSETKEAVKGLDAAEKSIALITKNTPGARTVEALSTLKAAIGGRVGQQEFSAYGKGMGIMAQIDTAISEAEGKGMSPQVQKFMSQIARTSAEVLSKEFDQHLKNAIQRNPEIDPLILKKRLVGEHGPSTYKATLDKVKQLPADAQALVNWAHDNPSDPKAQHYLQQISDKYKLGN